MLRMDTNVTRHLLFIKMTEIVEVTETITILIENDVLKTAQGSGHVSPVVDVATEEPTPNWRQLDLDDLLPGAAATFINKEERSFSRRIK